MKDKKKASKKFTYDSKLGLSVVKAKDKVEDKK